MATFDLIGLPEFPNGTSVKAYPRDNWNGPVVKTAAPVGTETETQTVIVGVASFVALDVDTRYTAYAQVGGVHKYKDFSTLGVASSDTGGGTGAADGAVVYGAGAPADGTGNDGDSYVDTTNSRLYGPKASGAWPGTYVQLGVPSAGKLTVADGAAPGDLDPGAFYGQTASGLPYALWGTQNDPTDGTPTVLVYGVPDPSAASDGQVAKITSGKWTIGSSSGSDTGRLWEPSDHGLLGWNFEPGQMDSSSAAGVAQTVYTTLIPWEATATITNLLVSVHSAGATLGESRGLLYTSGGTLIAKTADMSSGSPNWTGNGVKTMPLTAESGQSLTNVSGGANTFLIAAVWCASGTTIPQFGRRATSSTGSAVNVGRTSPTMRTGTIGSQATVPATIGGAGPAVVAGSNILWMALS